jgi:carboxymethylenebutenolidase
MVKLGAFERYLIEEFYDDYRDGLINKGTFTRRVAFIQGSMAAAAVAMTAVGCGPDELPEAGTPMPPTEVATVAPTAVVESPTAATPVATAASESSPAEPAEPPMTEAGAIEAEELVLPNGNEEVAGYFAKPAGDGPFPAVLVCHENRGLVDHIRDVTRRFADEGYVALALDLLWREGGTASFDRDAVPGMLTGAGAERHLADFATAFAYLQSRDDVDGGRIGMTGYCFGGGITWRFATVEPELQAAAPFYGIAPDLDAVPNIKAAMLGVYAQFDSRVNAGKLALEEALIEAGVTHRMNIYEGADHAFHNDTGPRFNEEQAGLAWADTLAWFAEYL